MISRTDCFVVGAYLLVIPVVGVLFRRFTRSSNDFFAAGGRMEWWLLGASSFASNFSCWVFTGAADIAYQYGALIFGIYAVDVAGFILSYLWFARRFRQLRLVTAMDGVRLRFGAPNEQFFTWITLGSTIGFAAVWLVSLSVILNTAFEIPPAFSIVSTGCLVTFVALIGGTWSVAACDFVQLLLLIVVTAAAATLTLIRIGGVGAFVAQVPVDHWHVLHPAGSMPYDWIYVVLGLMSATYMKNNLSVAAKYVAAADGAAARRSALVPLVGYLLMPVIWFVPPLAAYTLAPQLATLHGVRPPGESAYMAVIVRVLPPGLTGLMIAVMYSTTMSSMNTALNRSAAVLVRNCYLPLIRPAASDRELRRAGERATLLLGIAVTALAVGLVGTDRVSLFAAFLYLNSYLGVPFALPLFLGLFIRRAPAWAGWSTTLVAFALTFFLLNVAPLPGIGAWLQPLIGARAYGYVLSNKFVLPLLVTAPAATAYFLATTWACRHQPVPEHVEEFFRRMETPVDGRRERSPADTDSPARLLGSVALAGGGLVGFLTVLPNPVSARCTIGACALAIGVTGGLLLRLARRNIAAPAGGGELPEALRADDVTSSSP